MTSKIKNTGLFVVILVVLFLVFRNNQLKKQRDTQAKWSDLWEAQADTILKQYSKSTKEWEYSKLGLIADHNTLKSFYKNREDSLSKVIRKLVNDKKVKDVTVIETVTRVDTVVETKEVEGVYHSEYLTEYIQLKTEARKDSTDISLQMKLPLTISKSTDGRITVSTPVKEVEITELTGFTKVEPQKKKNWKYWVGGIVGGAVTYSIIK